jgi:hypothetical protein
MCLFFAAFAVQWCYPDITTLRASAGAFMLMVALLVVWCIWTARDQCKFWWFQPDPSRVEYTEPEEDERDSNASLISQRWSPRRFTTSLTKLLMFKSVPGESHAMQDTTIPPIRVVHDPPTNIAEPNFEANPHAA